MALQEEFETTGEYFFQWRSYLPLAMAVLFILALAQFRYPFADHRLNQAWDGGCLALALIGQVVRFFTVGFVPRGTSGRNTRGQVAETLNTTGMYAVVRNTVLRYNPEVSGWKSIGEGLAGGTVLSLSIDTRDPSCLYATTATGAFRTTDGGAKWLPFARTLQTTPEILVPHPWFSTRLLASGKLGIFVSTDRGSTWRQSRPAGKTPHVRSFTFRETNAGTVFGAASPAAVVFTQDGGISWESTRYGLGADSLLFLTLDDQDLKVCYAWTGTGGCYRSINSGLEWSRFSPPWNATDHVLFATDSRSATSFVALVNGHGVYLTTSGGTTWTRVIDRRLPGDPVAAAWHAEQGTLIVSLRDRGIYRLSLAEAVQKNTGRAQ